MSEIFIQEGLQVIFRDMDEFSRSDVVINDYAVFDKSNLEAPYIIIENCDEFECSKDGTVANTTWNIQVLLIERFSDWKETQDNFRVRRQAILDELNAVGSNRSAGLGGSVNIRFIRSGSPILEWYDPTLTDNQRTNAIPIFLFQRITLVTEEY